MVPAQRGVRPDDAAEALAGRLVSRVVPAAELMPVARALAEEIAGRRAARWLLLVGEDVTRGDHGAVRIRAGHF
jgi:enoyl-CoA hydratase/carnithine racemase